MKKQLQFKAIIRQDEDGVYVASCPSIPGCHSQGNSYEEAEKNIQEAIELCLDVAKSDQIYRDSIDFNKKQTPRFFGITDILVPEPNFV